MHPQCTFTPEQVARFRARITVSGECWIYPTVKGQRYGKIKVGTKRIAAHRFSYELHYGPIPEGLNALHNCPGGDIPACVNPVHLWLGTQADNVHDMITKGRKWYPKGDLNPGHLHPERLPRGEAHTHAKLTEAQVREIRRRHKAGDVSIRQLGREYGVRKPSIQSIIRYKTWKHVAD